MFIEVVSAITLINNSTHVISFYSTILTAARKNPYRKKFVQLLKCLMNPSRFSQFLKCPRSSTKFFQFLKYPRNPSRFFQFLKCPRSPSRFFQILKCPRSPSRFFQILKCLKTFESSDTPATHNRTAQEEFYDAANYGKSQG